MSRMVRDTRDEWPDDVPIGTFDITDGGLILSKGETVPGITAHILFVCPNRKRCAVFIGPAAITNGIPGGGSIWAWDGNREGPSLAPSINCIGGCGWHGFIQKGEMP